jgi:hypothetical protein
MKNFLVLAALTVPLLNGCYTPLLEGAGQAYDASRRPSLHADATVGDPVAEYELGNTYCCQGGGPMDKVSVYDNEKATHWYCQAARRGHGPAQLRLARIYSGHAIQGLNVVLRASALVDTPEIDFGVALTWANIAVKNGVEDAIPLREEIIKKATSKERSKARTLMNEPRTAPCQWAEVFPRAKNAKEKKETNSARTPRNTVQASE